MARQTDGLGRRRFLAGTAAGVGGAALAGPVLAAEPAHADTLTTKPTVTSQCVAVAPTDSQYQDVTVALNPRWTATPDHVYMVDDPSEIAPIVADAFHAGARLTVRSGGHCFDDFVYNADVKRIIDLTNMNRIYYDPQVNALAVESGAILLDVYKKLYQTWGVSIPAGNCYSVGMGGHVAGGGWGWMVRTNGLVVDFLYAVEVVTVDASGNTHTILATREANDPNRALWWAHTGGGGGNFGVVTRYLFRSPGATGTDPKKLLPKPPTRVIFSLLVFDWSQVTQADFTRLVQNFANWHVAHRSPTDPSKYITSVMQAYHKSGQQIVVLTVVDTASPNAQSLLNDFVAYIKAGVVAPIVDQQTNMTWMTWTKYAGTTNKLLNDPTLRAEYKSAYFKVAPTTTQLSALYKHLTDPTNPNPNINLNISPYGGATAAVANSATALQHRTAAFKILWSVQWSDPAQDAVNVAWTRNSYAEVFKDTGGVPVPNDSTDGCYINYVDSDMRDPAFNKSTVPWSALYYKDGYPQLQAVKKTYDPTNFFRHRMSIELPS